MLHETHSGHMVRRDGGESPGDKERSTTAREGPVRMKTKKQKCSERLFVSGEEKNEKEKQREKKGPKAASMCL